MKASTLTKKVSLYLAGIIIIIFSWYIYSSTKNNELIFPSLSNIIKSLGELLEEKRTYTLIISTLIRIIISLAISIIISLIITFLYSIFKDSLNLFRPILTIFKSTPIIIISIFIWMAFSSDFGPIFVNILVTIPIIVEGLINGINSIDQDIVDQFKLEKASKIKKFLLLELPINKNTLIMVILQTFGLSFKVMIMAEYLCQTKNSVGKTLEIIKNNLEMSNLIAWGIVIVILVSVFEFFINKISKIIDN